MKSRLFFILLMCISIGLFAQDKPKSSGEFNLSFGSAYILNYTYGSAF